MHKLEKCPHVLQSIPVPQKCRSQIGVDLIGPLCESNQKKYIKTCRDYFSIYVEAKATENKTGTTVATFLCELICRYGVMDIMITDQDNSHITGINCKICPYYVNNCNKNFFLFFAGSEFNNSITKELFRLTGIVHKLTSSYHPKEMVCTCNLH